MKWIGWGVVGMAWLRQGSDGAVMVDTGMGMGGSPIRGSRAHRIPSIMIIESGI